MDHIGSHVATPRSLCHHPALHKQNFPKPHEIQARERVLGWAAELVNDHDWFIQKAIAWWVRDLSRHDTACGKFPDQIWG